MKMELLWSGGDDGPNLSPSSQIGQALLYADTVTVTVQESDDLRQLAGWDDLSDVLGDTIEIASLDDPRSVLEGDVGRELLVCECLEAIELHSRGDGGAKDHLGLAWITSRERGASRKAATSELERLLESACSREPGTADAVSAIVRKGEAEFEASFKKLADGDARDELLRHAAVYSWLGRSRTEGSYALVDDAAGVWTASISRTTAMSGEHERRAAGATLGVGQIAQLPSLDALDWDVVLDIRQALAAPLAQFRKAMDDIAHTAATHPLDPQFPDFIRRTWEIDVDPAIRDMKEHARSKAFHRFFVREGREHWPKWAGSLLTIGLGSMLSVEAVAVGGVFVLVDAANDAKARRGSIRDDLRSNKFFFLYEVARRLEK
jgi:hypothetical protein